MTQVDTAERAKSRRVSALVGLRPFLAPYRLMILAAGVALVVTASVSLILPIAVRRVVDGFGVEKAAMSVDSGTASKVPAADCFPMSCKAMPPATR